MPRSPTRAALCAVATSLVALVALPIAGAAAAAPTVVADPPPPAATAIPHPVPMAVGQVRLTRSATRLTVAIVLACPAVTGGCSVSGTLTTPKAVRALGLPAVLGSGQVRLAPATFGELRVRLDADALRLVSRGKLAVRSTLTSTDAAGAVVGVQRTDSLTVPRQPCGANAAANAERVSIPSLR